MTALNSLALSLAKAGHIDEADQLLSEHLALPQSALVPPINITYKLAAKKRIDDAFEWMEQAIEVRDYWLTMLRVEPWFDNLRNDPRFETFMTRAAASGAHTRRRGHQGCCANGPPSTARR